MNLQLKTKINAILIVDNKTSKCVMSKDMNMTLFDWTIKYTFSDDVLTFGKLPNLLAMKFEYVCDGSSKSHKMSAFIYEDNRYQVFVNVFDNNLVESN